MADPKERAQIDLALAALPDAAVHPADWAQEGNTSEYLYRRNRVLARTEDAGRVGEAIAGLFSGGDDATGGVRIADGERIPGITTFDLVPFGDRVVDVPSLLDALDTSLGREVAHPDLVVYSAGYACPATEPEEVESRHPWPRAATDRQRGKGKKKRGRRSCCGCRSGCGCGESASGDGAGVRVAIFDTGLSAGAAQSHYWMHGVTGEDDPHSGRITYGEGHGTFSAGVVRSVAPVASVDVHRTSARRSSTMSSSAWRVRSAARGRTPTSSSSAS